MDIKTADRLQELRKNHGLSQEALSEKLGVSRQAISKWERGESSPDTDNLIALASIYGITLDDILNHEKEIKKPSVQNTVYSAQQISNDSSSDNDFEKVSDHNKKKERGIYSEMGKTLLRFPFVLVVAGIYVVFNLIFHAWHPGWLIFMLIPIYYHYAGACFAKTKKGHLLALPVPELVVLIYLVLGFTMDLWAAGAIIYIIIPLYYWGVAFYKKH